MAIVKIVKGETRSLYDVIDYVLDDDMHQIAFSHAFGFNPQRPFTDMTITKELWNKNYHREYRHFIVSLPFEESDLIDMDTFRQLGITIGQYFGSSWQVLATGHIEKPQKHYHYIVNTVNPLTGEKFSFGPTDLYRFKLYVSDVLRGHGLESAKMFGE